jgi:hypothetical protein
LAAGRVSGIGQLLPNVYYEADLESATVDFGRTQVAKMRLDAGFVRVRLLLGSLDAWAVAGIRSSAGVERKV